MNGGGYICEADRGVYDAMNKGVSYATGDYLCFMNSGDSFHSSSTLMDVFSRTHTEDILYGDTLCVGGKESFLLNVPNSVSPYMLLYHNFCHQSVFIKKEIQKKHLYDERYKIFADREFFYYVMFAGCSFKHLRCIIADYDVNGISSKPGIHQELQHIIDKYYLKSLVKDLEELKKYESYPELIELRKFISTRDVNRWVFLRTFSLLKLLFRFIPHRKRSALN